MPRQALLRAHNPSKHRLKARRSLRRSGGAISLLFIVAISARAQSSGPLSRHSPQASLAREEQAVVELLAVGVGPAGASRVCSATGFVVDRAGYLLTNAHVVRTLRRCRGVTGKGRILARFAATLQAPATNCRVIALDDAHDLAILRLGGLPQSIRFARLDPRPPGPRTRVLVAGHSGQAWKTLAFSGEILSGQQTSAVGRSANDALILNIPLRTGASGSPVFDAATGGVVGIIESRESLIPPRAVAIPIRAAIEFLDQHHIRWRAP